eukprot:jgi/Mesen1/10654/ME000009S10444
MSVDISAITEATAGAVGGLLSTTILYPLDTCKTKYQAEEKVAGEQCRYRSIFDVFREAFAERQLLSLYQGVHTKNFQAVVAGFTYFFSYSFIKQQYLARAQKKSMGTGANLIVAAAAAACTATITQPLDTLAARMQTSSPGKAASIFHLLKERGIAKSFDGLGASLLLTSNPAIQYTVFEQLKEKLLRRRQAAAAGSSVSGAVAALAGPVALSAFSAFLLGALSKTIATVLTYPAIRCKIMMQRAETEEETRKRCAGDGSAGPPKSMLQALRIIWHGEGVWGFYKGLQAQILKTVLAAALMLMIKEKVTEGTSVVMTALHRSLQQRQRLKSTTPVSTIVPRLASIIPSTSSSSSSSSSHAPTVSAGAPVQAAPRWSSPIVYSQPLMVPTTIMTAEA